MVDEIKRSLTEPVLGTFDVAHCDGTGLLRTEFLYMERSEFPSEDETYHMPEETVRALLGGL